MNGTHLYKFFFDGPALPAVARGRDNSGVIGGAPHGTLPVGGREFASAPVTVVRKATGSTLGGSPLASLPLSGSEKRFAAGAFSLVADAGTFALTGTAAGTVTARFVVGDPGAFTLSGVNAGLVYTPGSGAVTLVADPGAFSLTGTAATTIAARFVVGEAGSLVLTGVAAGTTAGRTLVGDPAAFSLTGTAAGTTAGRTVVGAPGAFTLNGSDATLTATGSIAYTLLLSPAAYSLTGFNAPLTATGQQDDIRSKGGFDPYYYKRRNKRRAKEDDVRQFVAEVSNADLTDAPPVLVAQAEDALQAAREALALRNVVQDAVALRRALIEINEFYRLVREQVRLRREADEDEDDELLLLH